MAARPRGEKKSRKTLRWSEESLGSIRARLSESSGTEEANTAATLPRRTAEDEPDRETTRVSDEQLFSEAMADVRERPEFRRLHHRPQKRRRPVVERVAAELDGVFASEMESELGVRFRHTDEYMSGFGNDIRADICTDLHAGRIPAQDHLDMHGLSLEEAKLALHRFIRDARSRGLRCVNVIHGRGLRSPEGPVLKEGLRSWLETGSLRKWVMAYATAPRKQGGPGATYLLLRSK